MHANFSTRGRGKDLLRHTARRVAPTLPSSGLNHSHFKETEPWQRSWLVCRRIAVSCEPESRSRCWLDPNRAFDPATTPAWDPDRISEPQANRILFNFNGDRSSFTPNSFCPLRDSFIPSSCLTPPLFLTTYALTCSCFRVQIANRNRQDLLKSVRVRFG